MKYALVSSALCALAVGAYATPAQAEKPVLHPPTVLMQSLASLREIASLAGLPAPIRRGTFVLPDSTPSRGWQLAAPGAPWNATDAAIDPSLPGRRLIFAACNAAACVVHYERGGIAHTYLILFLTHNGSQWQAEWLAYGHPGLANFATLETLLQNRSSLDYHDDTNRRIDY